MYANACFRTLSNPVSGSAAGLIATAAALLLVAGCATQQRLELPDLTDWSVRKVVLGGLDKWEFSGRIGVSAGPDGFNGKLRWAQQDVTYRATVSGPLGIGTVRIEGDGRSVVHTDKDGVQTELYDAEAELRTRYGWTIPIQSLRYWALGIPDPSDSADTEFNDDGQLATLMQRNWTVSFSSYREGGGQLMPNRLSAVNADTKVRLVIDRWAFFD